MSAQDTPTRTAWQEVDRLREQVREAEAKVLELDEKQRRTVAEYRQAKAMHLEYLRAVEAGDRPGDEDTEAKYELLLADMERTLTFRPVDNGAGGIERQPVDERLEARTHGARAAIARRQQELADYLQEHFAALAAELAELGGQARDDVEAALPPLLEAEARYRQVRARWRPLLEANRLPLDLPENPLRGFADGIDPGAGVPLPIPASLER